jgi:hypothetical protein
MAVACSVCRKQKVEMRALLGYWRLLDPEGTRSAPRDGNERYKASARGQVQHRAAQRSQHGHRSLRCQVSTLRSWELGAGSWELGACCCWIDGTNPADLKVPEASSSEGSPPGMCQVWRVRSDNTVRLDTPFPSRTYGPAGRGGWQAGTS